MKHATEPSDILSDLPEGLAAVLGGLEKAGFTLLFDAKLEDCRKKDGARLRTFTMAGRYGLALVAKNPSLLAEPAKTEAAAQLEAEKRDLKKALDRAFADAAALQDAYSDLSGRFENMAAEKLQLENQIEELKHPPLKDPEDMTVSELEAEIAGRANLASGALKADYVSAVKKLRAKHKA